MKLGSKESFKYKINMKNSKDRTKKEKIGRIKINKEIHIKEGNNEQDKVIVVKWCVVMSS